MPQPGFLDLDNRYAKLDGGGDPLVKIKSNIIMPTELPGNPVAEFWYNVLFEPVVRSLIYLVALADVFNPNDGVGHCYVPLPEQCSLLSESSVELGCNAQIPRFVISPITCCTQISRESVPVFTVSSGFSGAW